ncbi:hypothetical protein VTP01DRAFT_8447 [Rhizomucor pusillus]|uniref:uncharacterized protein n=1 Tax=Rhizomucor pusillus TaxID=4840 RepID=UPI0037429622
MASEHQAPSLPEMLPNNILTPPSYQLLRLPPPTTTLPNPQLRQYRTYTWPILCQILEEVDRLCVRREDPAAPPPPEDHGKKFIMWLNPRTSLPLPAPTTSS